MKIELIERLIEAMNKLQKPEEDSRLHVCIDGFRFEKKQSHFGLTWFFKDSPIKKIGWFE